MFFKGFASSVKTAGDKWVRGMAGLFSSRMVSPDFWDELEEVLISSDTGLETSSALVGELKRICAAKGIYDSGELKKEFAALLTKKLEDVPLTGKPVRFDGAPAVFLLIGVNGSGKTTTAGKLAYRLKAEGKTAVLAAADTFRAAAADQLKAWGEMTGSKTIVREASVSPATVVFDAIASANASGADAVIVDTAGRLHTQANLMGELEKIFRAVKKASGREPSETLLVLDSVTGQNACAQAKLFQEKISATGVILTKFDSTAKGGTVLAIADKLKLPVRYVGTGEAPEDLALFDAGQFAEAILNG